MQKAALGRDRVSDILSELLRIFTRGYLQASTLRQRLSLGRHFSTLPVTPVLFKKTIKFLINPVHVVVIPSACVVSRLVLLGPLFS
jgi:hypothetical protein